MEKIIKLTILILLFSFHALSMEYEVYECCSDYIFLRYSYNVIKDNDESYKIYQDITRELARKDFQRYISEKSFDEGLCLEFFTKSKKRFCSSLNIDEIYKSNLQTMTRFAASGKNFIFVNEKKAWKVFIEWDFRVFKHYNINNYSPIIFICPLKVIDKNLYILNGRESTCYLKDIGLKTPYFFKKYFFSFFTND